MIFSPWENSVSHRENIVYGEVLHRRQDGNNKKLNNEFEFIKNLRNLTGYSITDIRESIHNNLPFFAAETTGNEGEEEDS